MSMFLLIVFMMILAATIINYNADKKLTQEEMGVSVFCIIAIFCILVG